MTPEVLQGSPRLDGRRLAVGDIISSVDLSDNLQDYLTDFELNMTQIKECLDYCRTRQCIADSPNKYCHNCTLSLQQDKDILDEEQDNWLRAERLFKRLFSANENKILSDFHSRRQLFNKFIKTNLLDKFTCPSCGFPTLDERAGYEICDICNWEDDGQDNQNADQVLGGPNYKLSLTASRLQIGEELLTLAQKLNGQIITNPDKVFSILNGHYNNIQSIKSKMADDIKVDLIEPKSASS